MHGVHEDGLGYLWAVVYSSGLVRYDGVRMEVYTEEDGLNSASVWDVLEDAGGRLWVASSAGLAVSERPLAAYEDGSRVRFTTLLGGIALLDVGVRRNVLTADAEGGVWVGTDALGVLRYDLAAGTVDTLSTALVAGGANRSVRAIVARRDGPVWAGLDDGAVIAIRTAEEGRLRAEVVHRLGVRASTLYEDAHRRVWLGGVEGGVWRLDPRGGAAPVTDTLSTAVTDLAVSARGALWVASEAEGLLWMAADDPGDVRLYTRKNGLLSDTVHGLAIDDEGNVWVAQSGGLSKLRSDYAAFANYTADSFVGEPPLLPAPSVGAVVPGPAELAPCAFWAATSGGGIACVDRDEATFIGTAEGLTHDAVNGLAYHEGVLWIGTLRGINALSTEERVPPAPTARAVEVRGRDLRLAAHRGASVLAVVADSLRGGPQPESAVWFPAYKRAYCYAGGEWFTLGAHSGLPATILHAVAVDDAGYVWVGTGDHGLYRSTVPLSVERLAATPRAAGDAFSIGGVVGARLFERVWSKDLGAPTDQVESLLWHGGVLWAATPVGLLALQPEPGGPRLLAHLTQSDGLGAAHVYSLDASPTTGRLWAGTNAGLVEIAPAERRVLRRVTRRAGLVNNEVWYFGSVRVGDDGRVYFGTAKGVTVYDPAADEPNRVAPELHLRLAQVTVDESGHNTALFEYAATSFHSESEVRYRTRLAGYEDVWSAPTPEPKIRYTNLPAALFPKTYTFQVLAQNGSGVWTPAPLVYAFRVQPA
ncbi:MAG: hypothetical protein R3362_09975, partial [Rhodothermales bacterium]|nr:hypothetical protein [Rhodothermales bacterium]